ncbi:hypothetical protein [Vibrio alginolyticus]|uniref:hypothetical protein n=1 Tax=Vibrio alginolyticus TaxID=663 RepID=UPI0006CA765E|nr:hypothetical protein [Vibrio alginolyticus]KPM97629.1 hypothetical protein AOG25_14300 [Vibrio alginolyticus]
MQRVVLKPDWGLIIMFLLFGAIYFIFESFGGKETLDVGVNFVLNVISEKAPEWQAKSEEFTSIFKNIGLGFIAFVVAALVFVICFLQVEEVETGEGESSNG